MTVRTGDVLWRPPADTLGTSRVGRFSTWLADHRDVALRDHDALVDDIIKVFGRR